MEDFEHQSDQESLSFGVNVEEEQAQDDHGDEGVSGEPGASSSSNMDQQRRSTICAICNVDTGNYNMNYGANSCLSCRAFFRRSIQKTRKPNFKCKNDGKCEVIRSKIGEKSRKCRKCRFEKCLRAGMDPERVLDEEKFKRRFHKMLSKRHGEDPSPSTSATRESPMTSRRSSDASMTLTTISGDSSLLSQELRRRTKSMNNPSSTPGSGNSSSSTNSVTSTDFCMDNFWKCSHMLTQDSLSLKEEQPIESSPVNTMEASSSSENPYEAVMLTRLKAVTKAWNLARNAMPNPKHGFALTFCEKFLTVRAFKERVNDIKDMFYSFANNLNEFRGLQEEIREELLRKKSSLFIQFILGNCFSSVNLREQLRWIILSKDRVDDHSERKIDTTDAVSFCSIEENVLLFRNPSSVSKYQKTLDEFRQYPMNVQNSCLVAMALLFSADVKEDQIQMKESRELVSLHYNMALDTAEWASKLFGSVNKMDIEEIIKLCLSLKNIFEDNVNLDCLSSYEESAIAFRDCRDTTHWLHRQLENLEISFGDVSMGEEAIRDWVMITFLEPLSKNFVHRLSRMWRDRYRRVMMCHTEFNELSPRDQSRVWIRNGFLALGLTAALFRNCNTANEQLKFTVGRDDESVLGRILAPYQQSHQRLELKRVSIQHIQKVTRVLNDAQLRRYDEIVEHLKTIVVDYKVYKILLLKVLFARDDAGTFPNSVGEISDRYTQALKEHTDWDEEINLEEMLTYLDELGQLQKVLSQTMNH